MIGKKEIKKSSKKTPVSCTTNYLCLNIHSIDSFTVDTLNKVFTWQQYRHMPAVLFRNIQSHYLFSSQINASKFRLISHSCSGKNSNWLTDTYKQTKKYYGVSLCILHAQQNADTKLLINKLIKKKERYMHAMWNQGIGQHSVCQTIYD